MADLAVSTIAQGLMWSILAIGVFLSFRVLDVPDMTCEGSFPLGGCYCSFSYCFRRLSMGSHCSRCGRRPHCRHGYRHPLYEIKDSRHSGRHPYHDCPLFH